ncbi:MAG TPA: phosphotransferase [Candidatus Limnocylindria bacterium]|nr:phosphotransferase [Candidatus Limnocylindria bacterium]
MDTPDLSAWPITPRAVRPAPDGRNNATYFVDSAEDRYVLRVYRNTADPSRVRDEHELLGRLAVAELPFATPLPVRTTGGDTLAVLETPRGPCLAALFFRIPGEPADLSVASARLGGWALARVDTALGRLDLPVRSPAALRDVHSLVPDPDAALAELGLGPGADVAAAVLGRVEDAHDALSRSLPSQIVHGDFAFPNLLVDQGRVSGLVDFEFAGPDFRAADLAAALYVITVRAHERERWRTLEAFAAGYRRSTPLDPLEVAALPELMLRRAAIGLVHWLGRWRAGIADRSEPVARVERTTRFAAWIDENAARVALTVAGESLPRR